MDSDAAAAYLGIPAKTLKTKDWREENHVPYSYVGSKLIFDRLALDERFASCSGAPGGSYTVSRVRSASRRPFGLRSRDGPPMGVARDAHLAVAYRGLDIGFAALCHCDGRPGRGSPPSLGASGGL